jgi:rhodanese-related sulfurtransferase
MTFQTLFAFASDNPKLSLTLVGLTLALIYNEVARLFSGFQSVTPAQLTALINRDDALLIDLSAIGDFEKGHIAGAKNLPMSQFGAEHKLLAKARELPVAVTCRNGATSAEAAKRLVKAGFRSVYWLDGGVTAWQQAELPLVKGKA